MTWTELTSSLCRFWKVSLRRACVSPALSLHHGHRYNGGVMHWQKHFMPPPDFFENRQLLEIGRWQWVFKAWHLRFRQDFEPFLSKTSLLGSLPCLNLKPLSFYRSIFSILLVSQASDLWNKRHSVAIGDVNECKLIRRKEVTQKQVDHIWKTMTVTQYVCQSPFWVFVMLTLCCFSLQKVLGLKTLDGVLNPVHVNGRHIVHNVFSVNKTGIVVLENKSGEMIYLQPKWKVCFSFLCYNLKVVIVLWCIFVFSEDMPYWVVSAMKCLANCE